MRAILILVFLMPTVVLANDPWWKTAFPGSFETRARRSTILDPYDYPDEGDRPYYENEHPALEESDEPQVFHWDNIYLEHPGPEVIIDPYKSDEVIYWDEDEL